MAEESKSQREAAMDQEEGDQLEEVRLLIAMVGASQVNEAMCSSGNIRRVLTIIESKAKWHSYSYLSRSAAQRKRMHDVVVDARQLLSACVVTRVPSLMSRSREDCI